MEDLRNEQIEALTVMLDYIPKLTKAMNAVAGELSGISYPDTDEYLKKTLDGLNWVIGIFNGTMSLINEKEVKIDKEAVNTEILAFSDAFKNKDKIAMSTLLTGSLLDFVNALEKAAKEAIA